MVVFEFHTNTVRLGRSVVDKNVFHIVFRCSIVVADVNDDVSFFAGHVFVGLVDNKNAAGRRRSRCGQLLVGAFEDGFEKAFLGNDVSLSVFLEIDVECYADDSVEHGVGDFDFDRRIVVERKIFDAHTVDVEAIQLQFGNDLLDNAVRLHKQ